MHCTMKGKFALFAAAAMAAAWLAPSSAAAQHGEVCFYEHADFRGGATCYDPGERDTDLGEDIDDSFSSVDVPPGLSVEVCDKHDYRGRCRTIDGPVRNLDRLGMNDRISSLRVYSDRRGRDFDRRDRDFDRGRRDYGRGGRDYDRRDRDFDRRGRDYGRSRDRDQDEVCFYEHAKFRGSELCVPVGEAMPFVGHRFNDTFSSMTVPRGARVIICEHNNFQGGCETINGDIDDFGDGRWNDSISSFRSGWR